jgi:6-pyruvoyltetrahydropterin/6-carboxytetrahydropterin synthase
MYRIQVKDHFAAAHKIGDYQGKCRRLHGHRWDIEIVLSGKELNQLNMLVDFVQIKNLMSQVTEHLDHYYINEQLDERNVTAEFLAKWSYDDIAEVMSESPEFKGITLSRVTIWESPECCVKYSPEMRSVSDETM